MPMNSATRVSRLPAIRSSIAKPPQNRPKRPKINAAMAGARNGTDPSGHLLHHEADQEGDGDERQEEADAVLRAGRRVGEHARRVVLAEEHQHPRPRQQPQHAQAPQPPRAAARLRHRELIAGTVEILMGDRCGTAQASRNNWTATTASISTT